MGWPLSRCFHRNLRLFLCSCSWMSSAPHNGLRRLWTQASTSVTLRSCGGRPYKDVWALSAGVEYPYESVFRFRFRQPLSSLHPDEAGSQHGPPGDCEQTALKDPVYSDLWWRTLRRKHPLNHNFVHRQASRQRQTANSKDKNRRDKPHHFKIPKSNHNLISLHDESTFYRADGKGAFRAVRKHGHLESHTKIDKIPLRTPSEYLIPALYKSGSGLKVPRPAEGTVDLSFASPDKPAVSSSVPIARIRPQVPLRLCMQRILADYFNFVDAPLEEALAHGDVGSSPALDAALKRVFSKIHLEYLRGRGYSVEDVISWAWVLRSKNSYQAALRLLVLDEDQRLRNKSVTSQVPPFIVLLLLRQEHLGKATFRLLLSYTLHLLNDTPFPTVESMMGLVLKDMNLDLPSAPQGTKPRIEPNMGMTFIVRLLRHARNVWPQTQLTISRSSASFLARLSAVRSEKVIRALRINQFQTRKFNACLRLLSLPSKYSPFVSISIQQRAQFELLKVMAAHRPVLPVTREGYQAIAKVQLAHKKTLAERKWADYKAASWPPWKREKLGIDFQRGDEGMHSRVMHVISQMREAGYPLTVWEEVASILAGWDTDRSPTIQTRALVARPRTLSQPAKSLPNHPEIWAARIRSTRTLREAWACFLSYQDQGHPPRMIIYFAMAEKLVYRKKAIEIKLDKGSLALPGDGLEVFPEPISARDVMYVRIDPPALDDLVKEMLSHGIRPAGRFLALLLQSATTFHSGLGYLLCSNLTNQHLKALCIVGSQPDHLQTQIAIDNLPDYLFLAFIRFLCKFSNFDQLHHAGHNLRIADLFPIIMYNNGTPLSVSTLFSYGHALGENGHMHHPKTLAHAFYLIGRRKSKYSPPWLALLAALASERLAVYTPKLRRGVQLILAWQEIVQVITRMKEMDIEPGMASFKILCEAFTRVINAGTHDPVAVLEGLHMARDALQHGGESPELVCQTFEQMAHDGLIILKSTFDALVFPSSKMAIESGIIPSRPFPFPMLEVPSPSVLHAFVRALGMAEDYNGLLSLLRWMSRYAIPLSELADDLLNGKKIMRRTIVAFRAFLEVSQEIVPSTPNNWILQSGLTQSGTGTKKPQCMDEGSNPAPSDSYLAEAYNIIEETELWGSWPSDEEVQDYLTWSQLDEEIREEMNVL
ncbi:hypothetical protein Egran_03742 [Elaphomyces granulatus]|uniref:Uncharacterized protein n=1 Tax=Elaphomyces granulatus TaxID=519963 RepID=A0A232LWG2_9EURO|nr:hypothetical protein Egran_03742 [Elaphomyces granulatus]